MAACPLVGWGSGRAVVAFRSLYGACGAAGLALAVLAGPVAAAPSEPVRIGVLAKRGAAHTYARWAPTAEYLTQKIPDQRFTVRPLDFGEVRAAVGNGRLDFVLANPAIYVRLAEAGEVTKLATLSNRAGGQALDRFGGVLFTRADRGDIRQLADLRGTRLAAVEMGSLGGYLMANGLLGRNELGPDRGLGSLRFAGTHDAVVQAVLAGEADVGTVRTDTLERMEAEGNLDADSYRVIHRRESPGFPLALSTRLYPEWPLARVSSTSPKLGRTVADVLRRMPADAQAAQEGHYTGWLRPADYDSVRGLLRELKAPPYDNGLTLQAVVRRYWPWLAGALVLLVGLAGGVGRLSTLNRRLGQRVAELRQAGKVFENAAEGIVITDVDERIEAVNRAFTQITGYSEEEILGETPRILSSGFHGDDFYQRMWATLAEQGTWQGEVWNRRKDGEVYPEWQTITEVRNADGELVNYVAVFADITKARKTEEELAFLTYHDPLTELPNRALFRERLEHALVALDPQTDVLAVASLDLEGFGQINDSLGPEVGDQVLREAGQRLVGALPEVDTVSRPGGDEFWLLLEGLGKVEEVQVRIQEALAALRAPIEVAGRSLRLDASVGVALAPMDSNGAEELITGTTAALHRAQALGGGRVQFYQSDMGERAGRRLELEQALKKAIEGEELEVWYQPQVALATGRPVAAEALVRWRHPDWGLVSPGAFIPVAEESGLVVPLGDWVLEQAIRQCAAWRHQGLGIERVGINVAAAQLQGMDLGERVAGVLKETGLPGSCVELEITEEGVLADFDAAWATLERLAELGCHLAIDDFGTGYSSLAYLKRLPVDTLKIDKAFIDGLPADEHDRGIVAAIIAVARALDLALMPEGVETGDQAQWLRDQGVSLGQGFLYARPAPAGEVTAWLGAQEPSE